MNEIGNSLNSLRRPRLLVSAARFGLSDYNRSKDFRRITRGEDVPPPDRAVRRLMALEADQEERRVEGAANYSVGRHVDILIALMAEARLLLRGLVTP
jgi:hypothetical protein